MVWVEDIFGSSFTSWLSALWAPALYFSKRAAENVLRETMDFNFRY
jgi:hypothetical protein